MGRERARLLLTVSLPEKNKKNQIKQCNKGTKIHFKYVGNIRGRFKHEGDFSKINLLDKF